MNRILTFVVATLGLFACVWVSRVVLAAPIVEYFMPIKSVLAIALVAIVGGALPALLIGIAYGAIQDPPVYLKGLAVAFGASAIELVLASITVPWWSFRTWWVLPLEGATLVLCFPLIVWAVSCLVARVEAATRRGGGIILFAVVLLAVIGIALDQMGT
jgi:hypothetical protein